MARMHKRWTDAKFEVIDGPDPRLVRRDLPAWFKGLMFTGAAIFLLAYAVLKAGGYDFTDSQAAASAKAAPTAPAPRWSAAPGLPERPAAPAER